MMKHRLAIFIALSLLFFACTACTNKASNIQTTEPSNSTKLQVQQQIDDTTSSPTINQEPQPTTTNQEPQPTTINQEPQPTTTNQEPQSTTINQEPQPTTINQETQSTTTNQETQSTTNNNIAITESEVYDFFSSDNEFATNMLQYPPSDMDNLEDVIVMIVYAANTEIPVSFSDFNKYTQKYLNKTYDDSEFEKIATDEGVGGTYVIMDKRILYLTDMGGTDLLIENVEITGNDSALLTCSWGLSRFEPDTMREVYINVQFGKANSQLYLISISKPIKVE